MRKFLVLSLFLILLLTFTACKSTTADDKINNSSLPQSDAVSDGDSFEQNDGNPNNHNSTSGIELEEDVFEDDGYNENISSENSQNSNGTTDKENHLNNSSDNDSDVNSQNPSSNNSSADDNEDTTSNESEIEKDDDGTVRLPVDWF